MENIENPNLVFGPIFLIIGILSTVFYKQLYKLFSKEWEKKHMRAMGGGIVSRNTSPASLLFGTITFIFIGLAIIITGL